MCRLPSLLTVTYWSEVSYNICKFKKAPIKSEFLDHPRALIKNMTGRDNLKMVFAHQAVVVQPLPLG